jgi:hypothetical protein
MTHVKKSYSVASDWQTNLIIWLRVLEEMRTKLMILSVMYFC